MSRIGDGEELFHSEEAGAVPRTVVIDVANCMEGAKVRENCDALLMCEFARLLIELGFVPCLVIQPKYFIKARAGGRGRDGVTSNVGLFEIMEELGLVVRTDSHTLDDHAILQVAADVGGVVVSNDKYTDHRGTAASNVRTVIEHRLVEFSRELTGRVGEYIFFAHSGAPQSRSPFFALPADDDYEIVKDRRRSDWDEEWRRDTQEKLSEHCRKVSLKTTY